jgi:enediyne biosynthesis protein E4
VNELGWLASVLLSAGLTLVLVPASPAGQAGRPASVRPAQFVDVTARSKIAFVHKSGASAEKYMVETFGSGVAWLDYDNDGFEDLYFVNGAPGAANALYRNNKDGTFADVTAQARVDGSGAGKTAYKTGVAVGDYDNNGYLDLFVTSFGPDVLYKNNGDGTFSDVTANAGVAGGPAEWSTSTGFLDIDRDGDLDLYVTNYLDFRLTDNPYCGLRKEGYRMYCHPTMFDGMADRLFRNNGNGTFSDVSRQAGIANPAGKGLGVTVCDYDRDGDTDIYVANDMVRNFLYRNNGDGTFVDVAYAAGVGFDSNGKPQAGMGVDCADLDANGFPDLFVTNFSEELNTLYSNLGEGLFEDVTEKAGLGSGFIPLGFGTKMFDFDNDGDLDIHITNGHVIDNVKQYQPNLSYAQKDLLYENVGGRFRDVSAQAGPALQAERVGRGLAVADFDNDGHLDVAMSSVGRAPVLLKNQGAGGGSWITIRAQGTKSNRFGLGATVRVQTSNGLQVREINNVASYLSASDIRLHVGLGTAKTVQQIEVLWPSGAKQTLKDVAVNQILVIKEP